MTKEDFQFDKNNVEKQKAFDLVANTNTCQFSTVRLIPLQAK